MNKIVTLAFSLILSFGALFSQKIDYDNSSKWYLGFNFGGTWQTTDVANRTSGGWGLTLGRSYNYNYGRRLTFDIRGRYLGGYWYGQDLKTTDSAGYTVGPLKPYMDSLGFAVNNFQTELHSLSLELVLHANGVRERSGWDPYIFGGIGVKWYQTYGDLYFNDSLGGIYNYDPGLLSKAYVNSVTDGVYETALEGSQQNKFTVGLMPSLGFGIGYQVGKRVTLGLEHKTTFTLTDDFDGYAAASKYKQDLYHYTSAFINFRFRRGGRGGGSGGGTGVGNIDNYNNNSNNLTGCNPPVVTYIQPSSAGMNVSTMSYVVVADVKDVIGKENITFKHNGVNTLNFTYNPTTDRLEAQVILTPGSNTFEIYATNTCGSDTEGLSVNYQNCVAPVISLVNPSGTSASVSNPTFAFSAFVTNVDNPQGLTLSVNNRSVTNYSMNSTTGALQSNLNLIPGVNKVVVTATNACGTATETMTINYQNCVPPVITVLNPAANGTTVNSSLYTLNANVQNVSSNQGITLKQENVSVTNFSFNTTSGIVQTNVTLKPGLNTFVITATNACGTDSKTITINYTRELNNSGGNNTGGGNTGGGNNEQKITICHYPPGNNGNPQTIEIPVSAWPAHQAHGDKLGPCDNTGTGNSNNGGGSGNNGGGNDKITICHIPPGNNGNPQTIEIPLSAWPAHQAHGDKLGPCENTGTGNGNNGGGNGNNGGGNGGNNGNDKITICHIPPGNSGNPQTIEIPLSAWPAHQAHGDKLGPCDDSGTGNGNNGGGNGNNGNNGGGNGNNGSGNGNNGSGGSGNGGNGGSGNNGNGGSGNGGNNIDNGNNGAGNGNAGNNGTGNGNSGTGNTNNGGGNSGSNGTGNTGNGNTGGGNDNGNNGHGNNTDGIDSSNPGQGNGGPNGGVDGSGDDENGNGSSDNGAANGAGSNSDNGNSGGNGNNGSSNQNNSGQSVNGNGSGSENGSTGSGSDQNGNGSSGNGNSSNENGSGQSGNGNGSGSENGSTGSGSEQNGNGSSGNGNASNENGSGQSGNGNGSGSENGSTGSGSEQNGNGSSGNGNSSNENGSGQSGNGNGSGSENGSTGNGSNGNNNGSNGGNGGDGGNGGGSNKTKSASTGTNKGPVGKPAVKPAGTKVTDQKPGTPKPTDNKETKPAGTETNQEGGKTGTSPVKPSELKPGTGGGKGGN